MEIDYVALGKRIRETRKSLGLTQRYICDKVDISEKYISSIEHAKSKASLRTILNIAIVLETSIDYLVLGKPDYKAIEESNDLYQQFLNMTEDQKIFIKRIMNSIDNQE